MKIFFKISGFMLFIGTFIIVILLFQLIANILKKEFAILKDVAELLLDWADEDVLINVSVGDIVWGYHEPLINKTVSVLSGLGIKLNVSDKFGIFVGVSWESVYFALSFNARTVLFAYKWVI